MSHPSREMVASSGENCIINGVIVNLLCFHCLGVPLTQTIAVNFVQGYLHRLTLHHFCQGHQMLNPMCQ